MAPLWAATENSFTTHHTRSFTTHRDTQTVTQRTRHSQLAHITATNLPTIQTHQHAPARPRDNRIRGRLNSRSQPRSRTIPAADSEEAAPSEPDPAASRSESASPRLLESGRRNESASSRRVASGGGAVRPGPCVPCVSRLPPVSFYRNVHHVPVVMLARAVSATPPSIVTVIPVLGGPECVRALCWSQVKSIRKQQTTLHTEAYRMCSGGQQWWKGVGGDGGYDLT